MKTRIRITANNAKHELTFDGRVTVEIGTDGFVEVKHRTDDWAAAISPTIAAPGTDVEVASATGAKGPVLGEQAPK